MAIGLMNGVLWLLKQWVWVENVEIIHLDSVSPLFFYIRFSSDLLAVVR